MNVQMRRRIFGPSVDPLPQRKFQFKLAWGAVPHPQKAYKGGEDAIFASSTVLAVADGVSGWTQFGIDAGIYARALLANLKRLLQSERQIYFIQHPDELALAAVQMTEEKGSSTLTVLTLHPMTGTVKSFHVGDSVFGVFRTNGVHILAQEQQNGFDVPFQVYGGKINKLQAGRENEKTSDVFKGVYNQFSHAEVKESSIVLASDGLWDNVHLEEIVDVLWAQEELVGKAKCLVERSVSYFNAGDYCSPYYHKGQSKGVAVERGGKVDDISIIVAEVVAIRP